MIEAPQLMVKGRMSMAVSGPTYPQVHQANRGQPLLNRQQRHGSQASKAVTPAGVGRATRVNQEHAVVAADQFLMGIAKHNDVYRLLKLAGQQLPAPARQKAQRGTVGTGGYAGRRPLNVVNHANTKAFRRDHSGAVGQALPRFAGSS